MDDVIWNVLPRYREKSVDLSGDGYASDIRRIVLAHRTDSDNQRKKLLAEIATASIVAVVNSGDGQTYVTPPGNIYLAADRLKQLFEGVPGVYILDDRYECLRGEDVRNFLEACGALRYLRLEPAGNTFPVDQQRLLRKQAGHEQTSGYSDHFDDWNLHGLVALLDLMPTLPLEERAERAQMLWESLADLGVKRPGSFRGTYRWSHNGHFTTDFPSAFIRKLNEASWVPDRDGDLVPPGLVEFDSLGWKPSPFLLTQITFKPPILDQLAKEAGIDPAALDLLRKLGITSLEQLATRLRLAEPQADSVVVP